MAYLINVGFLCCVLLANEANGFDFGDGDILSSAFQELLVKIQEQGAKIASLEDTIRADRRDFNEKIEKSNLKVQGLEKTVESLKRIIAEMENKQVANNQDKISSQTENNTTAEILRPIGTNVALNASLHDQHAGIGRVNPKRAAAAAAHSVAFHAFMSQPDASTDLGQTMVFDTVLTNAGSSYNQRDGVFTAPTAGVYVFHWVTYSQHQGDVITELVINSVSRGCSRSDSHTLDEHHASSGLVVLHVSQGDLVSVRTHSVWHSIGKVMSFDDYYRSSFSGWLLV